MKIYCAVDEVVHPAKKSVIFLEVDQMVGMVMAVLVMELVLVICEWLPCSCPYAYPFCFSRCVLFDEAVGDCCYKGGTGIYIGGL